MSVRQSRRTSLGAFGLTEERVERRLAAILAADVVGYSRLMGEEEDGTLTRLKALRRDLIDPMIAEHRGRIVKTTGDGLLVEFPSVVGAVRCAVEVQRSIAEHNVGITTERRIEFRIGIHQGDVIVEDGDIFGDGVNIAARLEALAEPGGICVSDRVQSDAIGKIDVSFDDLGPQQVKNIARPVHVYRVRLDKSHIRTSLALPDKPSIAVLPFANMSGDPEQEYFADGMVEEIITALSRIRWLFVIARNSSFTYKGQAVDVKRVGRELGVRYVLEGSVRKGGNRVRITAQLIDAETGAHIWADRFDGALEDVFELQDRVATSVAGVIEPALQTIETRRSGERPTGDLTAYDLVLRAVPHVLSRDRDRLVLARELLGQAIKRDPHYGTALAWASTVYAQLYINGWVDDREAARREGVDFAHRALQAAPDDPEALAVSAFTFGYFTSEDIEAAKTMVDRSIALSPSRAHSWLVSGWIRLWAGELDVAIGHLSTSLRLNPRGVRPMHTLGIGIAHFLSHRFGDALPFLHASHQELPNFGMTYCFLAASYAHLGRLEEAQDMIARLRTVTPALLGRDEGHWRNPDHRELLWSGLRKAIGEVE
jgi:TolB-like protein/tetratricopeptide (TPR) repeat protein